MQKVMGIKSKLKEIAIDLGGDIEVKDVRIGLGYTGVMLEDGSVGIAYTFLNRPRVCCSAFHGLRPFAGRKAVELLKLFDAHTELESGLALATSNAITNRERSDYMEGDILAHIKLGKDDVVGMVGHFAPILVELKAKVKDIKIFEEIEDPERSLLPSSLIPEILPHCNVALISSTTVINSTIDSILDSASQCETVVMLGGSTPLVEDVFKDTPVTLLSGVVVTSPKEMLRVVSEGGGTRAYRSFTKKVNLKVTQG